MAKKNEQFAKEFKEISYTIINQMADYRLESYDSFLTMIRTYAEIRCPMAPETEAFVKQLFTSLRHN